MWAGCRWVIKDTFLSLFLCFLFHLISLSFLQSLHSPIFTSLSLTPLHHYLWHPTYQPTISQIKMHILNTLLVLFLSLLSIALSTLIIDSNIRITACQITIIALKSQSCANTPVLKDGAPECVNAQETVMNIGKPFELYNMTSRAEQAAVIVLMAFENVEFWFSRNQGLGVER